LVDILTGLSIKDKEPGSDAAICCSADHFEN
jgi:hypothetical protein